MAKIIGYDKKVIKKYKATCEHCGAIIVFDDDEVTHFYQYNTDYQSSKGKCPACEYLVSFNKDECIYQEEPEFYGWPESISNCIRDCKNCNAKCLYRKERQSDKVLDDLINEVSHEVVHDLHSHVKVGCSIPDYDIKRRCFIEGAEFMKKEFNIDQLKNS